MRGREGRFLREGPCADRYHLLAIAVRPDCSPDRRTEVAVEQRAFRLQLTLKLLQRPARTADLERFAFENRTSAEPSGRPVYIADTGAVIVILGDAQEPLSRDRQIRRGACARAC